MPRQASPPVLEATGVIPVFRYGHNVGIRKVLLRLGTTTSEDLVAELVLSPEDAEAIATQLLYHAKAARGEIVT
jgi:hypothetical protein